MASKSKDTKGPSAAKKVVEKKAANKKAKEEAAAAAEAAEKAEGEDGERTKRIGEEEEKPKTAQEIFIENLPTIVVVVIIAILIPVLIAKRQADIKSSDDQTWYELAQAKRDFNTKGEVVFEDLADKSKDAEAYPFVLLAWANRLYETGEKEKVEQALAKYEEIHKKYPDNPLFKDLPDQIKKIKDELADERVRWKKPTSDDDKDDGDEDAKTDDHDPKDGGDHDHDGDGKPDH